jgi:putative membrane protein
MDISMSAAARLLTAWDCEPSVIAGCGALMAAYCFFLRRRVPLSQAKACATILPNPTVRNVEAPSLGAAPGGLCALYALYFLGGVLLLALDLVSPLDRLADEYLFSAHIVQHFLLALIIPPLLLRGIPRPWGEAALRHPPIRRLEGVVGRPPVAWTLGVGVMFLWHVPALFNAALANQSLHIFQHLSFLSTGVIFWWPVIGPIGGPIGGPIEEARPSVVGSVFYLFTACLSCSLLGAILTFHPPGLYPAYLHPADSLGILALVRNVWGLDPAKDQQLGGLVMWVPGCFVYLSAILWVLARWHRAPDYTPPDYKPPDYKPGEEAAIGEYL